MLERTFGWGDLIALQTAQFLQPFPLGVTFSRNGFPYARRTIAQTDVAIVATGITEFGKAAMFLGFNEGMIIHFGSASISVFLEQRLLLPLNPLGLLCIV